METFAESEPEQLSMWTSSAAASPARTSATPATRPESTARVVGYGQSTPELLASYDRDSSSWRTSQHCWLEGLAGYSETWPRSGLMRNGTAYQLPPLAVPSPATGSSSWPTLKASDADQVTRNLDYFKRRRMIAPDLPVIVALCTPPTASGIYGRLTPTWCEWLMGFPIGHTALDASETASFQASRKSSAEPS
jgi:hypothetical protein